LGWKESVDLGFPYQKTRGGFKRPNRPLARPRFRRKPFGFQADFRKSGLTEN
jgi:hypothetical protein